MAIRLTHLDSSSCDLSLLMDNILGVLKASLYCHSDIARGLREGTPMATSIDAPQRYCPCFGILPASLFGFPAQTFSNLTRSAMSPEPTSTLISSIATLSTCDSNQT